MGNSIIKVEGIGKKYSLSHLKGKSKDDMFFTSLKQKMKSLVKSGNEIEEFWALKDVSFEIERGDRVGIIGRNGAGKSTLLKILSRIVAPTTGRIEYEGRMASLLEVGTGFHGDLSGRENIYLNGSILGMDRKEIKKKFDEIVAFSEVEKFLDTPVKRYSSGMYVRLAFAVAAHLDPDILIVDEVLAVGDAAFQKKCLGKMNEISKQGGRTILFVSHSMDAIQKLCNKGILLSKGHLMTSGSIEDVIKNYIESNVSTNGFYIIEKNQIANESELGKINSIKILNGKGIQVSEIAIGDSWKVVINVTINKRIENFVAGIGIQNIHGLAINTTWIKSTTIEKGDYEIEFVNNEILYNTGIYKLALGLSSNNVSFFYNDNEAFLNVSEAGRTINDERMINKSSGLLLNQLNYNIQKK